MKLKLKKYPKKPKAGASNEALQNYLRKVQEVNAENRKRQAEHKRNQELRKQVAKISSPLDGLGRVRKATPAKTPKKRSGGKKKKK